MDGWHSREIRSSKSDAKIALAVNVLGDVVVSICGNSFDASFHSNDEDLAEFFCEFLGDVLGPGKWVKDE